MLDLARKLDAVETSPGRSVLDDALLVFVSEAAGNSVVELYANVITPASQ